MLYSQPRYGAYGVDYSRIQARNILGCVLCGLFWGAHKSLAPRARTFLGGLGQATFSFFAVATLWFVLFCECPKFCNVAKQRRKIFGGVSEVGKDDFSLYFFRRCVVFFVFFFFCCYRATPLSHPIKSYIS